MKKTINKLIQILDLKKHPVGGYFKETYRSKEVFANGSLPEYFSGPRNYKTGMYLLLTADSFSAFHEIKQDEMWHFYQGLPITIHMISPGGKYASQVLGLNFEKGQLPQFTIPKHFWIAAEVMFPDSYSLLGCTGSPGFNIEDFKLADKISLFKKFPDHTQLIERLSRD